MQRDGGRSPGRKIQPPEQRRDHQVVAAPRLKAKAQVLGQQTCENAGRFKGLQAGQRGVDGLGAQSNHCATSATGSTSQP